MNTYSPDIEVYYGHISDPYNTNPVVNADQRLIPAPFLSVSTQFIYNNENIIGYSYTINFVGTITSMDLRDQTNTTKYEYSLGKSNTSLRNIGNVIDHINKLRDILTKNGGVLLVRDKNRNILLRGTGGILKSFNVDESTWTDSAAYSASIEFNNLEFIGSNLSFQTEDCENIHIDDSVYPTGEAGDAGLINLKKFKIKSFEDNWNISFDHESMTNLSYVSTVKEDPEEDDEDVGFYNMSFDISYSINAVGKDFFVYDNEKYPKVLPGWQQAKNFVQYRLKKHVSSLISDVLMGNPNGNVSETCNPGNKEIKNLFNTGSDEIEENGLLEFLNREDFSFGVFNETISCEVSESEGSFSASYKATIKSTKSGSFTTANSRHTFTKNVTTENTNGIPITNVSIQGNIEGLMPGGIINIPGQLELPDQGSLLIYNKANTNSKYQYALECLNKIYNPLQYNSGVGDTGKRDLNPKFKELLGLYDYNNDVDLKGDQNLPNFSYAFNPSLSDPPHPTNLNITHDYHNGSITYNVSYSNNNCNRKFREISIQTNEPADVIAVFNIPGSNSCPVIQKIGTKTAKTINISINGLDLSPNGIYNIGDGYAITNWADLPIFLCDCDEQQYLPINLPISLAGYIITQKQYTHNPVDGSYSINLTYLSPSLGCATPICSAI